MLAVVDINETFGCNIFGCGVVWCGVDVVWWFFLQLCVQDFVRCPRRLVIYARQSFEDVPVPNPSIKYLGELLEQVGEVSSDVLSFLSASAEYHMLDVVNDASTFRSRGKRARLTVDDVNSALELRGAEVRTVLFSNFETKNVAVKQQIDVE